MNNYKFRGKTAAGKWVYGFLLKNIDGKCAILDEDNTVNFNYLSYSIVKPVNFNYLSYSIVNPETVGQWTGLKDKNGKKIYEGDIVEITQGEATCKREVIFITAMFALRRDDMAIWICNVLPKDMEVVGNIHDNPELIKGSETK